MRFGPGGVPFESKKRDSLSGIEYCRKIDLGAMELEFVQGVRMNVELAAQCGGLSKKLDVRLSAHAPYFINFLSEKPSTRGLSKHNVLETAKVLSAAGGGRVVFHPAYYGKLEKGEAFKQMVGELKTVLSEVKKNGFDNAVIAPELTGKRSQWGSLEELIKITKEIDSSLKTLNPCFDVSHVQARGENPMRSREDVEIFFEQIKKGLGGTALKQMHFHAQDVEFTEKGERFHKAVGEGTINWKEFMRALVAFECDGTVICESPILEKDALKLQEMFVKAGGKLS
ncbi:TIM barrel protein [Candidatus Micrarchaeota archaeon]|nr:TIM barrel protein [Candidatus Micrarchaeota archaeon]